MRDVERAVENVLAQRIAVQESIEWNPIRRLENFSVSNMPALALGAAGAILGLSSMMLLGTPTHNFEAVDPIVVGSILPADHSASRAKWLPVKKPVQIMALEASQVAGIPLQYTAQRTEHGDHRDNIHFEARSPKDPELNLLLTRGTSHGVAPTLFIEMARQLAERGISVSKAGQTGTLQSKFGEMEVADMTFSKTDETTRACLAFRTAPGKGNIGLSGWYCAPNMTVADRPELSCVLDKLILLKGGQDKELRRFFTQAENNRSICMTIRASSSRKPTWLDSDGKVPSFRSDITGSIENAGSKKK